MERKISSQALVMTGMFAAVLGVLSQVSIPMPSGVPVTLQTFAVALTGYVLGWKRGAAATVVYVLLGAVGVPVFASLSGGLSVLVGMTGGFIWGFIGMAALCGLGIACKNRGLAVALGILGLAVCHLIGILQFSVVAKQGFVDAALIASVPYLVKDVISVVLALVVAIVLRRALSAAGMMSDGRTKEA